MNVLVVGAGSMGANHVRVYAEGLGVNRVVVAEPSAEARKVLSEKGFHNVFVYPSLEEALARERVEAASVVVPTPHHVSTASKLIAKGIPVLVEKPISDNLADARKLVKEAEKAKVLLMVGHIERFNPAVQALKKHLPSLGDVFFASSRRFGRAAPGRDLGEALMDQGVHDIDVMSYLAGKYPTAVSAITSRVIEPKYNDVCAALFEFDGFQSVVEVNRVTPIRTRELLVVGTKGQAHLDYINQELTIAVSEQMVTKYSTFDDLVFKVGRGSELRPYFVKDEPLKLELQHFLACVMHKTKPQCTGEDGIHALAAALAGLKAAKTGKREPVEA